MHSEALWQKRAATKAVSVRVLNQDQEQSVRVSVVRLSAGDETGTRGTRQVHLTSSTYGARSVSNITSTPAQQQSCQPTVSPHHSKSEPTRRANTRTEQIDAGARPPPRQPLQRLRREHSLHQRGLHARPQRRHVHPLRLPRARHTMRTQKMRALKN